MDVLWIYPQSLIIRIDMLSHPLTDFKSEIKNMSDNEKRIEYPNKIVDIFRRFLTLIIKIKKDKD